MINQKFCKKIVKALIDKIDHSNSIVLRLKFEDDSTHTLTKFDFNNQTVSLLKGKYLTVFENGEYAFSDFEQSNELKNVSDIALGNNEQGTVHIREVMAEFQCHKVVMAAQITEVDESNGACDLSMVITLPGTDISMPYIASIKMIARYMPVVGDYLVMYENDYVAISPKQPFEDGYSKIEFVNLGDDDEELNIPANHMDQVTSIAKMCHEILRGYAEAIREDSKPWEELNDKTKESTIGRVAFHILYPDSKPSAPHDNWMVKKLSDGWKFGKTYDFAAKTHPSLKPFHHLPTEQQAKDHIFRTIVHQAIKN